MYERIAADHRDATLAIASGVGIGMGGSSAYRAWQAAQAPQPALGPSPDAIAKQNAAIQRLQTLFASQPNAALRDAVKVD